ncbi:AlbA family DNA-binding domain-containing protein [Agromyces kandeliae]|uniref:ATP-binding protein n=1 Tax=Agromyces kandeliae TaxID=2666141 RepID=A0A6L5R5S3_9MICO|nr:ATP-binding protein [Agromyces kandeliae]MRX45329.1 ATP-binding protein [Agromyces kandeliae]
MTFTALHRALGLPPGPFTIEMVDQAIDVGVMETDDLDWKAELPPMKALPQSDFPKDVAAMANNGGGVIVYGVTESERAASARVGIHEFGEQYERALRSAAVTAITPPVFGLGVHTVGTAANRAVVVVVPASMDGPHLIFRNEYFGAPIRNDSDTVWMKERQIEAMYRARFDERRHATETLDKLYAEAVAGRDHDVRAWLVAVGHPRVPGRIERPTRDDARKIFEAAMKLCLVYVDRNAVHPLESVELLNPRPGLRRWVAANAATGERQMWREAWASIHHDGSVSIAAAVGGHRMSRDGHWEGRQIESRAIQAGVADFMALLRATAGSSNRSEYEVRVGIEWSGAQPLSIMAADRFGHAIEDWSTPLHRFTPVEATIRTDVSDLEFHWEVHDLARDCVNQGGVSLADKITPPDRPG